MKRSTGDGTGDENLSRCGRRCDDGSVCEMLVARDGFPCYHHLGRERVAGD